MRWLVPWLMLILMPLNLAIVAEHGFYVLCLVGQFAFYGAAFAAHIKPELRENTAVRIIYFFVQANLAIAHAACRFVTGTRMTTWQPSAR